MVVARRANSLGSKAWDRKSAACSSCSTFKKGGAPEGIAFVVQRLQDKFQIDVVDATGMLVSALAGLLGDMCRFTFLSVERFG